MTRKSGIASIVGICKLMPATPLAAQVTTGTILGTVQDNTGAVLNGAKISITGTSKGISLSRDRSTVR